MTMRNKLKVGDWVRTTNTTFPGIEVGAIGRILFVDHNDCHLPYVIGFAEGAGWRWVPTSYVERIDGDDTLLVLAYPDLAAAEYRGLYRGDAHTETTHDDAE